MKRFYLFFLFCYFSIQTQIIQHKFVIVICSYKNEAWIEKNLDSVFEQEYKNFRVIYTDDASPDSTAQKVLDYINREQCQNKITFIQNKKRTRKLANLYRAFHLCNDDEIILLLDGDDWLAHKKVLSILNSYYQNPQVWMTYGQYKNIPKSESKEWGFAQYGYAHPLPEDIVANHEYRKHGFVYMHPRSFYAWLFKLVQLNDLICNSVPGFIGDFYPASNDVATLFPVIEMAHTKVHCLPYLLYIRNLYSEIVGFKVDKSIQRKSGMEILKRTPYAQVKKPIYRNLENYKTCTADIIIHASDTINGIEETIEHVQKNCLQYNSISVLYPATKENRLCCKKIRPLCPSITFLGYNNHQVGKKMFSAQLRYLCEKQTSNYLFLFSHEDNMQRPIHLGQLIYWLEKTYALAFCASRSCNMSDITKFVPLFDGIAAWNYTLGTTEKTKNYFCNGTLYKKETIYNLLNTNELTPEKLFSKFYEQNGMELFFTKAPVYIKGNV